MHLQLCKLSKTELWKSLIGKPLFWSPMQKDSRKSAYPFVYWQDDRFPIADDYWHCHSDESSTSAVCVVVAVVVAVVVVVATVMACILQLLHECEVNACPQLAMYRKRNTQNKCNTAAVLLMCTVSSTFIPFFKFFDRFKPNTLLKQHSFLTGPSIVS